MPTFLTYSTDCTSGQNNCTTAETVKCNLEGKCGGQPLESVSAKIPNYSDY